MAICSWVPAGRCGNFFMEAFACFAYCKRHGLEFSVPRFTNSDYHNPIYLHHLQHPNYNPNEPRIVVREPHFHYAPIEFKEEWRGQNILLSGYWQSHRHWDEYRNEILEAFKMKWKLIPDVCSIHCRAGDYHSIPGKHILIDEDYLKAAMSTIVEQTGIKRFKVFSDDLPYFKQRFGNLYNFDYSTNSDIMDDLIEISCCHSNINSSSTFSWTAAYINRNPGKVIITQSKWFQDGWKESELPVLTDDIIPETWIKL